MKASFLSISFFFLALSCFGESPLIPKLATNNPKMYVYCGWNRAAFSNSDIHFKGNDYDFKLNNVVAKDRQSPFDLKTYFNPVYLTIPQYNFRFGYFINEKYNVSFGIDHMKYVMVQNQTVEINGEIKNSNTAYDGNYTNNTIQLKDDFLKFEHTDGLNYINFGIRRMDKVLEKSKFGISLTEGIDAGFLLPRTNTTLLNNERYDQFHLAGYGLSGMVGLNFKFFNRFFIQPEGKLGFINMPSIRTTASKSDIASQHFFFAQFNVVFGVFFGK